MTEVEFERFLQGEDALAEALRAALPAFEPSSRLEQRLAELAAGVARERDAARALQFEPPASLNVALGALANSVQQAQQGRRDAVLSRLRKGESATEVLGAAPGPEVQQWLEQAVRAAAPPATATARRPGLDLRWWWGGGASLAAALAVMLAVGVQWLTPGGPRLMEGAMLPSDAGEASWAAASVSAPFPAGTGDAEGEESAAQEPLAATPAPPVARTPRMEPSPPAIAADVASRPASPPPAVPDARKPEEPVALALAPALPADRDSAPVAPQTMDSSSERLSYQNEPPAPREMAAAAPAPSEEPRAAKGLASAPAAAGAPAPAPARAARRQQEGGGSLVTPVAVATDPRVIVVRLQDQLPARARLRVQLHPDDAPAHDWLRRFQANMNRVRPDVQVVAVEEPGASLSFVEMRLEGSSP